MQITLNLDSFGNDALRNLAYALAMADGRNRDERKLLHRQLIALIVELEHRTCFGRDTSELREMAAVRFRGIKQV